MKKDLVSLFSAIVVLTAIFGFTLYNVMGAVPLGPDSITDNGDETLDSGNYPAENITAYAGNISNIDFDVISQTKHWQGYYGDITGVITLDDADNYTLYDWPNAEPKGEMYATPISTTPAWATVICFNFTGGSDGGGLGNVTYWETYYNMTYNDVDGIDETFNMTQHPTFDIGDVNTITTDTCPSTYLHMSDLFQEDKWSQILLEDEDGDIIFTTIIENDDEANNTDIQGYKDIAFTPDFQLIVAEDGTSRNGGTINTDTTPYYFYLDLE